MTASTPQPSARQGYRAAILHFSDCPDAQSETGYDYWEDGLLLVENGKVVKLGDYQKLSQELDAPVNIQDYRGYLLMPGFIDTHIHYPQSEIMASYGEQLLDWLNHYTFPAEGQFASREYARQQARFFLDELYRNGTTTAQVYGTVHPESVEAFFEEALGDRARMLCGKVMMDRNAPETLCDTAQKSYEDSLSLIERWHGKGRLGYVVTPRFAITSTPEQLRLAGQLYQSVPGLWMQTHLSENLREVEFVKELFPNSRDYLDVYEQVGLLGDTATFGHGIHLSQSELNRLSDASANIAFCPTSNLFLGSGLLDVERLERHQVPWSLATDVGGGTSFSMLQTLSEAYKICQLKGYSLNPFQGFYQLTLGNARALQLDDRIGRLAPGHDADFVILDWSATPIQAQRQSRARTLQERLFALMMLGDDRSIYETYVAGHSVWQRDLQGES